MIDDTTDSPLVHTASAWVICVQARKRTNAMKRVTFSPATGGLLVKERPGGDVLQCGMTGAADKGYGDLDGHVIDRWARLLILR